MAFIRMIGMREAEGELAETYAGMAARKLPAVYKTEHGDAAAIIRVHSLDPALMRAAFGFSGTLGTDETLSWAQRELVNAVTSARNGCFY